MEHHPYADAPVGHEHGDPDVPYQGMDVATIHAAAQQLERLQNGQSNGLQNGQVDQHVMDQLMMLGQNLGSGLFKPEDYFANLQAMNGAAQASGDEEGTGVAAGGAHGMDGLDDLEGSPGPNSDKPLTSKFRGVCWNKKNRRWQAAINSSGKYIYLGSYVQEDEAAKSFDRAAIRLRGQRAKLNYHISTYQDEFGQIIEDKKLSEHLTNILGKEAAAAKAGKASKSNNNRDSSAEVPDLQSMFGMQQQVHQQQQAGGTNSVGGGGGGGTGNGGGGSAGGSGFEASQHLLASFQQNLGALMPPPNPPTTRSPHYPYNGGQRHNYGVLDVPEGCSLTAHIPGDEEVFAVLYTGPMFVPDSLGAAVWDGHGAIDLGVFDTDRDARQAAGTVLRLVMYHRHPLAGATGGGAGSGACNQGEPQLHHHHQYRAAAADGEEGEGGDPAFTAAAAAAAAAASNGEAHEAGHEDDGSGAQGGAESEQAQYNALFQWLAQYHQVTLVQGGEGEHGVDDGVEANTDANGCRPKSVRDEEGEHQTVGPSTKRARGRRGSMQSMVVPKEEAEGMMHGMDQVYQMGQQQLDH